MTWSVEQAEIVEWLKGYDGPRFHSILSDPPYALISISERFGKPGSAPARTEGNDGSFARLSGGFMNMRWDGGTDFTDLPSYQRWVTEWGRLLIEKAVHPGAIGAFFGGTRTSHRLACGLEDAGWIVWDTLMWITAQGFPKAHDTHYAINRELCVLPGRHYSTKLPPADEREPEDHVCPETPEGLAYRGHKSTALKPAYEPVVLVIAPRQGHTYADLALKFGTGAINVDGCRIGIDGGTHRSEQAPYPKKADGTEDRSGSWARTGHEIVETGGGRYPSNVILSHAERCADEECAESCPVRMLDEQAGESSPGHWPSGSVTGYGELGGGTRSYGGQGPKEAGGKVSRFFYCSKADRFEREAGLDDLPEQRFGQGNAAQARIERGESNPENVSMGYNTVKTIRNDHPTQKPIDLCRYLATLLLPPKIAAPRRLLVPFSGAGSEMIGALLAGWDEVTGIEREAHYAEIARARIPWWIAHPDGEQSAPEIRASKEKGKSAALDKWGLI